MSLYSSAEVLAANVASRSAAAAAASSVSAPTTAPSGWTDGTCVTDDAARLLTGACEYFQPDSLYLHGSSFLYLNGSSFLTRLFLCSNETAMTSAAMTPAMCQNFCSKYACEYISSSSY